MKSKPKYSMPRNIAYVLKLQFARNKLSLLLPVITIPLGLIISFLDIYLPKLAIRESDIAKQHRCHCSTLCVHICSTAYLYYTCNGH